MGNISCTENLCSDNLYEISWINSKNWDIKYNYDKIENPYILNRGNFKIMNNGYCFLVLNKKIDFEYEIKKILINFIFDFKLKENNFIELFFVLNDELIELNTNFEKNIISKIVFSKNNIKINNENIKLNNFKYELLFNFSYLNYILYHEILKKKDNIILDKNNSINYEKKLEKIYFSLVIKSNLNNNTNVDNYLNIKIL
tara:strand:- start:1325 stop:1924 length:600 start_codon:yes stop_codon:yes gene_type:complete